VSSGLQSCSVYSVVPNQLDPENPKYSGYHPQDAQLLLASLLQAEKLEVPKSDLTVEDLFELKKSGIRVNWRGKLVIPDGTIDADGYLAIHEAVTAVDIAASGMVTATVAAVDSLTDSVNNSAAPAEVESESITQPLLDGLDEV
jgi:hypothetical protein